MTYCSSCGRMEVEDDVLWCDLCIAQEEHSAHETFLAETGANTCDVLPLRVPVGPDGKGPLQGYDAGEAPLWSGVDGVPVPWCDRHNRPMEADGNCSGIDRGTKCHLEAPQSVYRIVKG